MTTRRDFLQTTFTASVASCLSSAGLATVHTPKVRNPLCVFTKPFNSLTAEDIAARSSQLGFDGIEAPVRSGGHIEPEAVVDQLPAFVESLQVHNQRLLIMTSDINDPHDGLSESVLRTAASLGIRYYRMKYFRYDESRPILPQVDDWKRQLVDLAALNRQLGLTAVYQNHAGRDYFGAALWDLQRALEVIDPQDVGVAYDIRHATVEAGMSWPIGFRMIRPHLQVVYVKDFDWGDQQPTNVPLGQGRISRRFFQLLADSQFDGPISLHEEYLDHTQPELVPDHWTAIEKDLKTLRSWMSV